MRDIVDSIKIPNFFLGLNGMNYDHVIKIKHVNLYLYSFPRDGERNFTRNNDKYRPVSCQPQIAIFSSIKSDKKRNSYESENILRRCQNALF